jgi:hypothetical protein
MNFKIGSNRSNKTQNLSDLIPDVLDEFNLEKSFTINEIVQKWSIIVGDIISTHSLPIIINKKQLLIIADHSIYAHEITTMKEIIIKKINNELSYQAVLNIKVMIKPIRWNQ